MHRVVTKAMIYQNGIRKREIDEGPWQPSEDVAKSWAQYLKGTGRYDSVTVQSNGQRQAENAVEEDLFLDMGN
jgi:hypothetical protein